MQADLGPFEEMLASLSAAIRRTDIFKPHWCMDFQDLALKLDVRVQQEKKRRAKEEEKFEKKRNEDRAVLRKEEEAMQRRQQEERAVLQRKQEVRQKQNAAAAAAAAAAEQQRLAQQQLLQHLERQREQRQQEQELWEQQQRWCSHGSMQVMHNAAAYAEDAEDDKTDDMDDMDDISLLTELLLGDFSAPAHDVSAVQMPAHHRAADYTQHTLDYTQQTLQHATQHPVGANAEAAAFYANMSSPFQQIDLGAPPGAPVCAMCV